MRRKLRKTTNRKYEMNGNINLIKTERANKRWKRKRRRKTYVNKIDVVYCNWVTCFDFMHCSANLQKVFVFFVRLPLFSQCIKSYHCTNRSTFPTIKWLFWGDKKKSQNIRRNVAVHIKYTGLHTHSLHSILLYNLLSLKIVISLTHTSTRDIIKFEYTCTNTDHTDTERKTKTTLEMVLRLADDSYYSWINLRVVLVAILFFFCSCAPGSFRCSASDRIVAGLCWFCQFFKCVCVFGLYVCAVFLFVFVSFFLLLFLCW